VRSDIDDHVAVANRDRALFVDVAGGLLEGEQIELASIPFVPPEPAQRRLPQDRTWRCAGANRASHVEAGALRPSWADSAQCFSPPYLRNVTAEFELKKPKTRVELVVCAQRSSLANAENHRPRDQCEDCEGNQ
jgi:hypothetical protein